MIKKIRLQDISKELSNIIRSDVLTSLTEPGLPFSVMYSDYLSVEIPDFGFSFYEGLRVKGTEDLDRCVSDSIMVIIRDLGTGLSYEVRKCEDIGESISRFIMAMEPEYEKHNIYLKAGDFSDQL